MIVLKEKPDILGTIASALCLVHCVATPFIFIVQTCNVTCCEVAPWWWQSIDYIFLIISFFAIYWSTKSTAVKWIKPMLWLSWLLLVLIILNEKLLFFSLPDSAIYIPALALVILHLYNRKYCQCKSHKCCVKNE
ncbi:MerC domain-containing protein [Algibacter pectinivorans]|uniref:MerC domain-containing protein n=1 Tax=Algibacter pectinivorans TaxID=870482 RepID=UPI000B8624A4|nr:MerC domain-containing protein [Algibacter pectinivorans]